MIQKEYSVILNLLTEKRATEQEELGGKRFFGRFKFTYLFFYGSFLFNAVHKIPMYVTILLGPATTYKDMLKDRKACYRDDILYYLETELFLHHHPHL